VKRRVTFALPAAIATGVAAVAAGCAQIASLGDAPVVVSPDAQAGTAAGGSSGAGFAPSACATDTLNAGAASCQACVTSQCCAQAAACSEDPGCAGYEQCLLPCGGDYACRSRCYIEHPPSSPRAANLDACLVARCAQPCQVSCGASSYTEPASGDGCHACITEQLCGAATACLSDPACSRISQCTATTSSLDHIFACAEGEGDGGAGLFTSYLNAGIACMGRCGIGSYWECLAHPSVEPSVENMDLTLEYTTNPTNTGPALPVAGAAVRACPVDQLGCPQPLASGVTDAHGDVRFQLSAGLAGVSAYFVMDGTAGALPLHEFFEFGFTVKRVTLGVAAYTPDQVQGAYAFAGDGGVPQLPGRGTLQVVATDCHWAPAPGVSVVATGIDEQTTELYPAGGTATATGLTGQAYFLNAPEGPLSVSVVLPGVGIIAHDVHVLVQAGAVSVVFVHPNP